MGWATSRWIFIALAGLSLSGCQMFQGIFGGGRPDTQPPAADESGEWRQIATSADRDRLRRLRAAWTHALQRSEEHTSELQSLMRISYAVFCLKKKIFNFLIYINTSRML